MINKEIYRLLGEACSKERDVRSLTTFDCYAKPGFVNTVISLDAVRKDRAKLEKELNDQGVDDPSFYVGFKLRVNVPHDQYRTAKGIIKNLKYFSAENKDEPYFYDHKFIKDIFAEYLSEHQMDDLDMLSKEEADKKIADFIKHLEENYKNDLDNISAFVGKIKELAKDNGDPNDINSMSDHEIIYRCFFHEQETLTSGVNSTNDRFKTAQMTIYMHHKDIYKSDESIQKQLKKDVVNMSTTIKTALKEGNIKPEKESDTDTSINSHCSMRIDSENNFLNITRERDIYSFGYDYIGVASSSNVAAVSAMKKSFEKSEFYKSMRLDIIKNDVDERTALLSRLQEDLGKDFSQENFHDILNHYDNLFKKYDNYLSVCRTTLSQFFSHRSKTGKDALFIIRNKALSALKEYFNEHKDLTANEKIYLLEQAKERAVFSNARNTFSRNGHTTAVDIINKEISRLRKNNKGSNNQDANANLEYDDNHYSYQTTHQDSLTALNQMN